MTFGERLKQLRQEKEMNQKELGEVIGVGARMISFYENNEHIPRDANSIIKLAEFFDVSIDYLFGASNIRNSKRLSLLNKTYDNLPPEGQSEAIQYIEYLISKHKK